MNQVFIQTLHFVNRLIKLKKKKKKIVNGNQINFIFVDSLVNGKLISNNLNYLF